MNKQNKYAISKLIIKQVIEFKMENRYRQQKNIENSPYFQFPLRDTFQLNKYAHMQKSFISTVNSRNSGSSTSLDKLKIRSLPNHNQQSLSSRERFILVFQAIQIQRLSQQVERQRKKLRDFERQTTNFINYQVQIKQLSDKCINLERQVSEYRVQLQNMNKISQKIYLENQNLKGQIRSRAVQSKDIKISQYENIITQLKKKIQLISAENQRIYKNFKQKPEENTKMQKMTNKEKQEGRMSEILKASPVFNFKKTSRASGKEQITQQMKITKLSQQIYRLSEVMLQKNNQIWSLQNQLSNMKESYNKRSFRSTSQQKRQQSNYNVDKQKMNNKLINIKKQYEVCKEKLTEKEQQCDKYRRNQVQIFKDLNDINKLRIICENQQNQILQNLRQLNKFKLSTMLYESNLNYSQTNSKFKNNNFYDSICAYLENMNLINPNDNLANATEKIINKINELQSRMKNLKNNYNDLLKKVGEAGSGVLPITLGSSFLSD